MYGIKGIKKTGNETGKKLENETDSRQEAHPKASRKGLNKQ